MPLLRIDLDRGIGFHVFLSVAAVICDRPRGEIDIVTNNACAPRSLQEFRKAALPGLVRPQRRNQCFAVKRGTSTVPIANGVPWVATGPSLVRYRL